MERETGFEPATSTLARLHSTTELLPLTRAYTANLNVPINSQPCQEHELVHGNHSVKGGKLLS